MTEQGAQYDHIGSKYDEYARTATLKRAESYTFFRMVGALDGQARHGSGLRLRLLYAAVKATRRGAGAWRRHLAGDDPPRDPAGAGGAARHHVSGVRCRDTPPTGPLRSGHCGLSARLCDEQGAMLGMFRSVYDNLVAGGRFIAYTINPDFTLSKPNCTKYGVTVLREEPEEDRYVCEAEFVTDPPARVRWYRWSQAAYEWAIKEAGFRDFAWYPSEVAPEDVARYGEAYWRDFHDNCIIIGLVCQK